LQASAIATRRLAASFYGKAQPFMREAQRHLEARSREAYGRFQLDQGWLTHSERRKVL
jgi:hypothetical protein